MLDRHLVAEQPDAVRAMLRRRHADPPAFEAVDRFLSLEADRKRTTAVIEEKRRFRNESSNRIPALYKEGRPAEAEALKAEVRTASDQARTLEEGLAGVEQEIEAILLTLPNRLDDRVQDGLGEEASKELSRWGEPRAFDFEPLAHDDLGTRLGILDMERAARMSGARFAVLKGAGALLERGLVNFFLDLHVREHGYTEVMVPYVVGRSALVGTGQLPKFEDDLFRLAEPLNGQDAFLVPTAEVPVTNLHRGEILEAATLPLRYCCFTPCFRAEAGSYGRDVKGLIRQHQFHKVELVHITTPDTSDAALETLTGHAEVCLRRLELPYRKVRIASGEQSAAAAHQIDLEVWLPSQQRYREISSCSNFWDYQARRLGLRFRASGAPGKGRTAFCHTLNGSGLAVGRTLVAVLENHQQADGSVRVPRALRPFLGGLDRIGPPE
ncbi:MAG: serine--tRNA ligase [Deltaproteobacteria bacterium]|nr:serine--tRNA ligase [Deltaproteobacteria bacterium]